MKRAAGVYYICKAKFNCCNLRVDKQYITNSYKSYASVKCQSYDPRVVTGEQCLF